jgi:transcriptional regulator of acetoin/glycerol metabolism
MLQPPWPLNDAKLGHQSDLSWENYVIKKSTSPDIRPPILSSWNRCRDAGIDAFRNRAPLAISGERIRSYKENDQVFAEIASILSSLRQSAFESRHMLVCCDSSGNIMHLEGEKSLRKRAEAMNFVESSSWSEATAGTNAIGTAIAIGEPVQVVGSEHYCQEVHPWTCSASPILEPATRSVLGVIDLTGLREAFHPHTLAAVVTAAQLIEERLRRRFEVDKFRLLELYIDRTARTPDIPIAVLDAGLRVVKAAPALYEKGWIDLNGQVIGCPLGGLAPGVESNWEGEGVGGRWTFTLQTCTDRGRPIGVVIQAHANRSHVRVPYRPDAGGKVSFVGRTPRVLCTFESLLGQAPSFRKFLSLARSVGSEQPVLIQGETGTGKELVAQAIHSASARRGAPFLAVNCAAVPKELAAAEFFGFEGGSFTGAAKEGRSGKFEQANGGTIFLDEIGDMPLDLQALLLRVLEEDEVVHIGGRKVIPVDVRLIAATNHDLSVAIEQGKFRRDLYYRLNVISLRLPSLRERCGDIEILLNYYLDMACKNAGRTPLLVDREALLVLQQYSWPGNIRELRNIAQRLVANVTGNHIHSVDLPTEMFNSPTESQVLSRNAQISSGSTKGRGLKIHEMKMIRSAIEECQGNITAAAHKLGIDKSTIYRRLGRGMSDK